MVDVLSRYPEVEVVKGTASHDNIVVSITYSAAMDFQTMCTVTMVPPSMGRRSMSSSNILTGQESSINPTTVHMIQKPMGWPKPS